MAFSLERSLPIKSEGQLYVFLNIRTISRLVDSGAPLGT